MGPRLPQRRTLPHATPSWVQPDALLFVTICSEPRGTNQPCLPDRGPALLEATRHYQTIQHWHPLVFLLMPDHVHLLAGFAAEPGMQAVVSAWKRYTARQFGITWQRDFFEHRIRHHESAEAKVEYIRMNPVRAGLVERPEDWPWVILSEDFS